jgi:hypothetical protein
VRTCHLGRHPEGQRLPFMTILRLSPDGGRKPGVKSCKAPGQDFQSCCAKRFGRLRQVDVHANRDDPPDCGLWCLTQGPADPSAPLVHRGDQSHDESCLWPSHDPYLAGGRGGHIPSDFTVWPSLITVGHLDHPRAVGLAGSGGQDGGSSLQSPARGFQGSRKRLRSA